MTLDYPIFIILKLDEYAKLAKIPQNFNDSISRQCCKLFKLSPLYIPALIFPVSLSYVLHFYQAPFKVLMQTVTKFIFSYQQNE